MNVIEQLRKEQHQRYLETKWFPSFCEKYSKLMTPESRAKKSLLQVIKTKYPKDVLNMSKEELDKIPGIYRMRISLDDKNLVNPNSKPPIPEKFTSLDVGFFGVEEAIDSMGPHMFEEHYRTNRNSYDEELQLAIEESLRVYNDDETLNNIEFVKSENVNFNETFFNLTERIEQTIYLCIDLQIYGPHPGTPIEFAGETYYLNQNQIKKVKQAWNKINPHTSSGLSYQQDLEYYKGMCHDLFHSSEIK